RFNAWASVAGVTLALRYRGRHLLDGELVDGAELLVPTSNRVLTTTDLVLPIGFLTNIDVFALSGAPPFGTVFMTVQLIRGAGAAATVISTLLQAYVAANVSKAWPGSLLENPLDGPGVLLSITGGAPAAGAEISETMPAGTRRQLYSFRTQLTTSAAAGNRNPSLRIDDGANEYVCAPDQSNTALSTIVILDWFAGSVGQNNGANNMHDMGLPGLLLLGAGHRIRTNTVGILAGDQYTAPQYLVREWLTAD
ncbi:MAG TPA: hypothetical protein VJN96_08725, partial [Vicinamibacterales bacterium]|nr:hypothetical protein [Vicinamibacterales bacterium]